MVKSRCDRSFLLLLMVLTSGFLFAQDEPVFIEGYAQGTTFHIMYLDEQQRNFENEIVELLKDFDHSVSTYDTTSIISRVNANDSAVVADSFFITCFVTAKDIWRETYGDFDPTVMPLVNMYGFGPEKNTHVDTVLIDSLLEFVGFELITLEDGMIVKKDPRVSLDFNAFAQGYSVDVVSDFLLSHDIDSYLVEIGGELYAHGRRPDGEKWLIGIEQPVENKAEENQIFTYAAVEDRAVATSGNYRRFVIEDGVKYTHQIDPKTGYPSRNKLLSTTVFAEDCLHADAIATALLVMGLDGAIAFLEAHPEYDAYLIYSNDAGQYEVYTTPGLNGMLRE